MEIYRQDLKKMDRKDLVECATKSMEHNRIEVFKNKLRQKPAWIAARKEHRALQGGRLEKNKDLSKKQQERVLKFPAGHHDSMILHTTLNSFINSYGENNNPGTIAEISTGVQLIISTGLDSIQNLDKSIKNWKIWEKITPKRELGMMFMGMIGLYNYTQDDNVGKADIGVVFPGLFVWKYSITKLKHLTKDLSNIGTQGINFNKRYYDLIREQYKKGLPAKIARGGESGRGHGIDEHARIVYEKATEDFADHINKWPDKNKKEFMFHGLGITEEGKLDSDGIIYSDNTGINFIYLWDLKYSPSDIYYKNMRAQAGWASGNIKPNKNAAKTYVNLSVKLGGTDHIFIRIQVKFNDGLVVPVKKWKEDKAAWEKRKAEHKTGKKPLTGADFEIGRIGSFNFVANDIRKLYKLALVYQK